MESYVEQARELVKTMRQNGGKIGDMESSYAIQYAFYAEDLERVYNLAYAFSKEGYEVEHGLLNEEFLKPYDLEIQQKKEKIQAFVLLSDQVAQVLDEGTRLFERMQKILNQMGLGKLYGDYVYEKEQEEKSRLERERKEQEKKRESDKEKGGRSHCLR